MRRQELHPRTAVINKSQKNQSKMARYEALDWLAAKFPRAFDNTLSINPLKVGIIDDVLLHAEEALEAGISRSKLREALVLFTRRIDYLTCIKAREMRIDLDGNPVEMVSEEDAEKASLKIKKRIEKCVRNARKTMDTKAPAHYGVKPASQKTISDMPASSPNNQSDPHYIERMPMYSSPNTSTAKPAAVIVTHKGSRQFDPEAVARLKEKLGLSRKAELTEETVD